MTLASFPGLHTQLLLLAVQNLGRRPGWIYHVMRATADVLKLATIDAVTIRLAGQAEQKE